MRPTPGLLQLQRQTQVWRWGQEKAGVQATAVRGACVVDSFLVHSTQQSAPCSHRGHFGCVLSTFSRFKQRRRVHLLLELNRVLVPVSSTDHAVLFLTRGPIHTCSGRGANFGLLGQAHVFHTCSSLLSGTLQHAARNTSSLVPSVASDAQSRMPSVMAPSVVLARYSEIGEMDNCCTS